MTEFLYVILKPLLSRKLDFSFAITWFKGNIMFKSEHVLRPATPGFIHWSRIRSKVQNVWMNIKQGVSPDIRSIWLIMAAHANYRRDFHFRMVTFPWICFLSILFKIAKSMNLVVYLTKVKRKKQHRKLVVWLCDISRCSTERILRTFLLSEFCVGGKWGYYMYYYYVQGFIIGVQVYSHSVIGFWESLSC